MNHLEVLYVSPKVSPKVTKLEEVKQHRSFINFDKDDAYNFDKDNGYNFSLYPPTTSYSVLKTEETPRKSLELNLKAADSLKNFFELNLKPIDLVKNLKPSVLPRKKQDLPLLRNLLIAPPSPFSISISEKTETKKAPICVEEWRHFSSPSPRKDSISPQINEDTIINTSSESEIMSDANESTRSESNISVGENIQYGLGKLNKLFNAVDKEEIIHGLRLSKGTLSHHWAEKLKRFLSYEKYLNKIFFKNLLDFNNYQKYLDIVLILKKDVLKNLQNL